VLLSRRPHLSSDPPRLLCAGIAVFDDVFQVEAMPAPDSKINARAFTTISGGNAANAAVTAARLGARTAFAGPLGDDDNTARLTEDLQADGIDCSGCVRVENVASPLSAIFVDDRGRRTIITYRDQQLAAVVPRDPAALVAEVDGLCVDNRFPQFVTPLCVAARARGLPIVLDVDKPTAPDDPLLSLCTHVIFSAHALLDTVGMTDIDAALAAIAKRTPSFVGATDGENEMVMHIDGAPRRRATFAIEAVDTLAAGDVFHGAFAVRLLEGAGLEDCFRFAAAAAAVKCQHFGGSRAIPRRAAVDAFLAERS
jgi:sugar/nucleoside kinase (ribokinase family)